MDVEQRLGRYAAEVNSRLEQLLPSVETVPVELHSAMRYSCLAPGKRMRPALCMAAAEAVGGATDRAIDAGCAIEMVHCFSLIHDDLPAIDDDDLRRGLPTCHKKFGEAVAILAGDALFALAFDVLANCGAAATVAVKAIATLTRATGSDGLVGGETVDILSEGKPASPELLHFIHAKKTGALIAASCQIGALIGGGSEEQCARLRRYGERIGLAFQIADDLLNETSTKEQLGKSAGSDRERGKITYPAVFGLAASRDAAHEAVRAGIEALGDLQSDFLRDLATYSVDRLR